MRKLTASLTRGASRTQSRTHGWASSAFIVLAALATVGFSLRADPAGAQSATCQEFQKTLEERQSIVQRINQMGKKKVHPRDACALFTQLQANGQKATKWLEVNKDWCQIPQQFVDGFTGDQAQVTKVRGQACSAAAKFAEAEKRAKEGPKQGLLGGGGLTGEYRVPRGAL